jgi:hypothetical protein
MFFTTTCLSQMIIMGMEFEEQQYVYRRPYPSTPIIVSTQCG